MQVHHCTVYIGMAKELLYCKYIYAVFQQMRGISVAQHVCMHFFEYTGLPGYCLHCPLHTALAVPPVKAFAFSIACAFK